MTNVPVQDQLYPQNILKSGGGILGYNNITNCITEIPQDIKLELNNSVLTLKAGSKVYVPNGAGVFDVVTIANDVSHTNTSGFVGEAIVVFSPSGFLNTYGTPGHCSSGDSWVATYQYNCRYNTTENRIKWTSNNGSTWSSYILSLPFAKVYVNGAEGITEIRQVFNGFGYIGSTAFVLPGVKGLIPNGRNADGTLKNIEFTVDKVITRTITWNNAAGQDLFIGKYNLNEGIKFISTGKLGQYYQQEDEPSLIRYAIWYKPSENKVYRCDLDSNSLVWKDNFPCFIGQWFTSGTSPYPITELTTKLPFRAVDYNDLPSQAGNDGKFLTTNGTTASWADVGGGLEIGDIGIAPLGIDETQNKRRYLNGQVISQAQFVSFTNKIKSAIELTPSLATSETNWQAEVTNSKLGQCGKFVIDDALGTIRLPKVVNVQGLQDLSLLGGIKAESLPNITGDFGIDTGSYSDKTSGAFYNSPARSVVGINAPWTKTGLGFDASRSSSTYQDNAPVQQEAIQYPYFIQVATGVEESVDVTREIELNNPFSLFDYKWSEYEITNASWLLSNGQFNSGATYPAVYELLLKIHNGTETKDGVSVKLSTEVYTDTDFVINTADTTFRLPIKVANTPMGGTAPVKTSTSEINVMGMAPLVFRKDNNNDYPTSGTYLGIPNSQGQLRTVGGGTSGTQNVIPANLIADLTQATNDKLKLYFYVGETIQDANVINASGVLTRVAELSDSYISGLGMPSDRYIELTLGASGSTYTAPANGYFVVYIYYLTRAGYVNGLNDNTSYQLETRTTVTGTAVSSVIPARKDEKVRFIYDAEGTKGFRFIYAEGESR